MRSDHPAACQAKRMDTMRGLPYEYGLSWPRPASAYDYVLTLSDAELAWEFLRRNSDYQIDVSTSHAKLGRARRLASGQHLWRGGWPHEGASKWDLCSFRRSRVGGPRCPRLLARHRWRCHC